jgi:hypothetical protein
MAELTKFRYEPFAQALSRDLGPVAAAKEAGFKGNKTQSCKRALRPEVVERVEELRRRRDWGGSRELGPLIDELMAAARQARTLKTAAAFVAVRGLIVEAARLKKMLPEPERPFPRQMTPEEWEAKYAPKIAAATQPPV